MRQLLHEACSDESGKVSSARLQSMILVMAGVLSILVGFVLLAYGVKDVSTFLGVVLTGLFGKGASDLWAAQLKSAKVKSATVTATATTSITVPGAPPTTTAMAATTKAADKPQGVS